MNDANDKGSQALQRIGINASCVLPLQHESTSLGVLVIHAHSSDFFEAQRLALLRSVADMLAYAIHCQRTAGERDLLAAASMQAPESVLVTDRAGHILYVNPAFEQQTGFTRDEVLGRKPSALKSGLMSEAFYRRFWATLLRGETFHGVFANRRKNGDLIYEEKYVAPIKGVDGEITHFISTGRDITERRRLEDELRQLAYYDPLTNLPNRRLLNERLEQLIKRGRRKKATAAVIIADLNNFKIVNDSLGHLSGDDLLVEVARRFSEELREDSTLARLGGDEFAILLHDSDRDSAARVAQRLVRSLEPPVMLADTETFIGASFGIARFPQDGEDPETLLRNADVAMYRAKARSESGFALYDAASDFRSQSRLGEESMLRTALLRAEIQLVYQPIVDARTGVPIGVEVLARWPNGKDRRRSPNWFIALAEESDLICELDHYILRHAIRQTASLPGRGMKVAVNIAPKTLLQPRFPDFVKRAVDSSGFNSGMKLCVELTERTLASPKSVARILKRLNGIGVDISVDDFGTGYSSLAYLSDYPLRYLKIDKTFVAEIGKDHRKGEAIITTIIELARSLGLKTVAEGVETQEQRLFLEAHRCDALQGYLIARPMPVDAVRDWLASRTGW